MTISVGSLSLIMMIGAPGSGKTTWSKQFTKTNSNVERVCPDEFRAKFGKDENDQSVSAQAFAATRAAAENILAQNKSVIIDATNMHRKARTEFIKISKKYNAKRIAVVFNVSRELLIDRNIKRGNLGGRNVPVNVIDQMLEKYQEPVKNIEFDEIIFIKL